MTLTLESATEVAAVPVRMALDRAVAALLDLQHGDGRWQEDPARDRVDEAQRLAAHLTLAACGPGGAEQAIAAIRSAQWADGAWSRFPDGGPDLAATAVCCAVLRLAGDPADSYPVAAAVGWLRAAGWRGDAGESRPVRRGLGRLADPEAHRPAPVQPVDTALASTALASTALASTALASTALASTVLER
ncbi:MAG: hypothetical protein ACYCVZ_19145, partial [Streptosporangiaceae bacterium]